VAALGIAGCSQKTAAHPQRPLDVARLKVTGTQVVKGGLASSLAPDGQRVAFTSENKLCVADIDGAQRVCTHDDKLRPELLRYSWSRDGTKLALTDNFFEVALEPDIWVMDTSTGDVRDVTDDGVNVWNGIGDATALLDEWPSWSADGADVRFARQRSDNRSTIQLESVPAGGGKPHEIGTISGRIADLVAVAWSPDGKTVAWTMTASGAPKGTTHIRSASRGSDRVVLPAKPGLDNSLLSFSPDGAYLLIDSLSPYEQASYVGQSAASIIAVDGGKSMPVASGENASWSTWAPDSDALAYIHYGKTSSTLRIVGIPGGQGHTMRESERMLSYGLRLSWSRGNRILLSDTNGPVVLTVGS